MSAPIKEARQVLCELLRHAERLQAVPSATGGQLERLRLGMTGDDDGASWRSRQHADRDLERTIRYARLLAALEPEELAVARVSLEPVGLARRLVQVRSGDLVYIDRQGGEIVGTSRDLDGQHVRAEEGCVFVETPVPIRATQAQVAVAVGLSVYQVRERTKSTLAKVRAAVLQWAQQDDDGEAAA